MGDVKSHHSPNLLILNNYFGYGGGGSGILRHVGILSYNPYIMRNKSVL
jgi:hypothetical protein